MPGGALKTQDKQLVTSVSVLDPLNPDKYKFLFTKSIHIKVDMGLTLMHHKGLPTELTSRYISIKQSLDMQHDRVEPIQSSGR